MSSHSPEFKARVLALHARQAKGECPPPGEISQDQLAAELGLTRRRVRNLERSALAKFRAALAPLIQTQQPRP
jgi:hypothetical protein